MTKKEKTHKLQMILHGHGGINIKIKAYANNAYSILEDNTKLIIIKINTSMHLLPGHILETIFLIRLTNLLKPSVLIHDEIKKKI